MGRGEQDCSGNRTENLAHSEDSEGEPLHTATAR
jgi:hypothetical protein